MNKEYRTPSWSVNEQQVAQIREIVKNFASDYRLREGLEYRPNNASAEEPILIQEYFRLFLTPREVIWEGILDPKDDYAGERTLIDRIRKVVPGFASKQELEAGER